MGTKEGASVVLPVVEIWLGLLVVDEVSIFGLEEGVFVGTNDG